VCSTPNLEPAWSWRESNFNCPKSLKVHRIPCCAVPLESTFGSSLSRLEERQSNNLKRLQTHEPPHVVRKTTAVNRCSFVGVLIVLLTKSCCQGIFRHCRLSFVVRRLSFVVRRSSFVVRRSSFVVRRSSFVVRRSSFVVRRSSSSKVGAKCADTLPEHAAKLAAPTTIQSLKTLPVHTY